MSVAGLGLGADLRYLESGSADDVRRLLASTFPQEKLHGMKSIFGMAALNQNVIIFFADVVKNVVIDNMEVKKLVYMYLVRYAGEQPDLALLSVNSFQRDLGDANAAIRALALRVMAAIRVPLIRPLVIIAVQKAAVDVSSHVRKAVANALPSLLPRASDVPTDLEAADAAEAAGGGEAASTAGKPSMEAPPPAEVIELLTKLLGDRSSAVVGAAAGAFLQICPERLELLHRHYYAMVEALADTDEWNSAVLLTVLLRYTSANFPLPADAGGGGAGERAMVEGCVTNATRGQTTTRAFAFVQNYNIVSAVMQLLCC